MNDKQQLAAMGEHMREVMVNISSDWGEPVKVHVGDSVSSFQIPLGWKLVPASPTAEMLNAAAELPLKATRGMHDSACYRVMLDAAPECKP